MYTKILVILTKKRPNSLTIEWNEPWGLYEDADFNSDYKVGDRVWKLSYYERTPVGCVQIENPDFEGVMEQFVQYLVEKKILSSEDFDNKADAMEFKLKWGR